jgi:guanine nucleotide-binding protein subunit alpha
MSSSNARRIFSNGYLLTDQDILRTRLRTTGIVETDFHISGVTYRMCDVGGQRSERKKWIHAFEGVNVLLFLAAISGFDQALPEDRNGVSILKERSGHPTNGLENQMTDALQLFEQIVNSRWFVNSTLILFLNKMDLFSEKLQSGFGSIKREFPDYEGHPRDVIAGRDFFTAKFRRADKSAREMWIHYTNAIDTSLLKITMEDVQQTIVKQNLQDLIL